MAKSISYFIAAIVVGTLTACVSTSPLPTQESNAKTIEVIPTIIPTSTLIPTPTPEPPKVLSVCMGAEPSSLFLYADSSSTARNIRQAIYDGPIDIHHGVIQPVILESIPSLSNGGAELQSTEAQPGDLIMDAQGEWVSLQNGVRYRPSGCTGYDCAQAFESGQTVSLDKLVVRFRILPGLLWSDGTPLTANDSVFSFSVAKSFYGNTLDVLRFTESYTALDEQTIEWVSIPGYQGEYADHFFSPLPHHQLGLLPIEQLLTTEASSRMPLGWGPYIIDEWTLGDHITLSRNPNYFRSAEGLPAFDYLVFRFVPDAETAVDALLVGECDYLDQTSLDLTQVLRMLDAQENGSIALEFQQTASWEQLVFGIDSLDDEKLDLLGTKEIRQALAMCIDRQRLVDELLFGRSAIPDGYLFPAHILHNPDLPHYEFDPQKALELFAVQGWVDYDQDPSTPLAAVGIAGIPDFTPFEFSYLIPDDSERIAAAQIVTESLAQCGIQVDVQALTWTKFLAPGPEGPVFGRNFELAQFAWAESPIPACYLYLSEEIPGPYPDFPKGWGGGNLSGYQNPEFDQVCQSALTSLPDTDEYVTAHQRAQEIFAEELPVIPLYWRLEFVAMRPDMCNSISNDRPFFELSNIEDYNYGESCLE